MSVSISTNTRTAPLAPKHLLPRRRRPLRLQHLRPPHHHQFQSKPSAPQKKQKQPSPLPPLPLPRRFPANWLRPPRKFLPSSAKPSAFPCSPLRPTPFLETKVPGAPPSSILASAVLPWNWIRLHTFQKTSSRSYMCPFFRLFA